MSAAEPRVLATIDLREYLAMQARISEMTEMLQRCESWLSVDPDGRDMQRCVQDLLERLERP